MKAIICDCCGNVTILEEPVSFTYPKGAYRLSGENANLELDLCEDCAKRLTTAIRKEVGEDE